MFRLTEIIDQDVTNREKPKDSSMLLLADVVKLRVDVIFLVPPGPAVEDDSRPTESRRGELVEPESLSCVV